MNANPFDPVLTVTGRPADGPLGGFPLDRVDQLAAVTSGLTSLAQGVSRVLEGGIVNQTVVDMRRGLLIVMAIGG